jgi:sulfite exporter TauE/SafE
MNYSEGILLGLSTGAVCLAYCGPVLIPYLMGENKNIKTNFVYVSLFLSGRLLAYLAIGLLAGIAGAFLLTSAAFNIILIGISYIVLSVMLIAYGFYQFKEVCLGQSKTKIAFKYFKSIPFLLPVAGGVLTGLNICPPFLLAITKAASTHQINASILFFTMFFIGTSLYFLPLPFIGIFKKQKIFRIVGKFAAILAGLLYLYKGLFMLIY